MRRAGTEFLEVLRAAKKPEPSLVPALSCWLAARINSWNYRPSTYRLKLWNL